MARNSRSSAFRRTTGRLQPTTRSPPCAWRPPIATREAAFASQVDLLPTVIDVAGLPAIPGLAGVSLRKIRGGEPRALMSVSFPKTYPMDLHPQFRRVEEGLTFGGLRLIVSTSGKRELYDLAADEQEDNNLYREGDTRVASLTAMMEQWKRSVTTARAAGAFSEEPQTMDRLRSLGYVQ